MLKKNRKLTRLRGFDYAKSKTYFVTICTKNKEQWFGKVEKNKMILNEYGEIVRKIWLWLAYQYPYVHLDRFIIMPNHIHGIISIKNYNSDHLKNSQIKKKTLSSLIGAFKTKSSKLIHKSGLAEFKWQKSFYDHILRKKDNLRNIRYYILYNPSKWENDIENIDIGSQVTDGYYNEIITGGNK